MYPQPVGASNVRLKRLKRLVGRRRARSQERALVVEGARLVVEAIDAGHTIDELFVSSEPLPAELAERLAVLRASGLAVPTYQAEAGVLASLLDPVNPQPVADVLPTPVWTLADVADGRGLVVAVELRDPGNLGTLLRTAEAAGMGGVVVAGDSVDVYAPKVVRASAGSVFRVPVIHRDDPAQAVAELSRTGRPVVAAVVDPGAEPYDGVDLSQAALLVGNEPRGLAPEIVSLADRAVTIPVAPTVESLNVAAATAVLCFEAARQRRSL